VTFVVAMQALKKTKAQVAENNAQLEEKNARLAEENAYLRMVNRQQQETIHEMENRTPQAVEEQVSTNTSVT
jgi:hypothetical protein